MKPKFTIHPRDPVSRAERNIILTDGTYAGEKINICERSRWMIDPLEAIDDDTIRQVEIQKAAGCGGTYIIEIYGENVANNLVGNIGFQAHTGEKAKDLAKRTFDKLTITTAYKLRMGRHLKKRVTNREPDKVLRKDFSWGGNYVKVQGANLTNAQMDRLRQICNDEGHEWENQLFGEFRKRLEGENPYRKEITVSTAARNVGHELHRMFSGGTMKEYLLCCPKCHKLFLPLLGGESRERYDTHVIRWPNVPDDNYAISNVVFVCPHCDAQFRDRYADRMSLQEGAAYEQTNPNPEIGHESFRFRAWCVWFVEWKKLLAEWLDAKHLLSSGDSYGYEEFRIKREAVTMEMPKRDNELVRISGDFKLEYVTPRDIDPQKIKWPGIWGDGVWIAPEWTKKITTFITVDVQQDYFWCTVWQVGFLGICRSAWIGKVRAWEDIKEVEEFFGVRQEFSDDRGELYYSVGIDCATWGYSQWEVYKHLVKYGWFGLEGEDTRSGFKHTWDEADEDGILETFSAELPFSEWQHRDAESGRRKTNIGECGLIKWSNRRIKDQAKSALAGHSSYCGFPSNYHEWERDWRSEEGLLKQLDSETLMTVSTGQAGQIKKMYEKRYEKAQNHLWDCFCMLLVMIHKSGLFDTEEPT